jgi:hypothetical protein
MYRKHILSVICVILLFQSVVSFSSSSGNSSQWDNNWSFKQEIKIPIDTSLEDAKYQPIDIRMEFDNPCWAKNEKEQSVRVVFKDAVGTITEIESQIYDLDYLDDSHIKACSLVFLIPEEANGKEKYFVYYDAGEKPDPGYTDHVGVEESYYRYEPIPGYVLESRYYKIMEEGNVVYAVSQEGKRMGVGTSQQVTKLKEGSTEILPKNGELFASFDFWYYYGQGGMDYSSTVERLISKEIFVDGNLMVEFGIVSGTFRGDLQTTAAYKYYYCPGKNKRICAHLKQETLKECDAAPGMFGKGVYASLQCGGVKSNSIEDLNFGKILKYLHIFTKPGLTREFVLIPDPAPSDGYIEILGIDQDVELGEKPWASFDDGEAGVAHSLILGSTSVVKSGTDERAGIRVNAVETDNPHILGFECDSATVQFCRNSPCGGGGQDLKIPKGFIAELDVDFFSSENGGYKAVERETELFAKLVKIRPSNDGEASVGGEDEGKCSLTTYIHLAPSSPMGSALSVATGKDFSYISAELYAGGELISSEVSGRLSINGLPNFNGAKFVKKIKIALGIFDWKNFSFFKKVRFENIPAGKYLVKIYKENSILGGERRYIGFKIVDVKEDTKIHVFCRPEGAIKFSVFDQDGKAVKDVQVRLTYDNNTISEDMTNQDGMTTIKAPCSLKDKYDLKLLYDGFVIYEKPIKLGYVRSFLPIKKSINIELYDVNLKLEDAWGFVPEFEINSVLVSKEMDEPILIYADKISDESYIFTDLYPGEYKLELKYKSFLLEKNIQVSSGNKDGIFDIVFPAEFNLKTRIFDSRGLTLKDARVVISRNDKKVESSSNENGFASFLLPPGTYQVKIYSDDDLIGERKIHVFGEETLDFVTTNGSIFPSLVACFAVVIVLLGTFFVFRKRDIPSFLKIMAVALAIVAVACPWWALQGSTDKVETTTSMFLNPAKMITTTITSDVIAGEITSLPDLFVSAMNLLPLLTAVGCTLIILSILLKRFDKKRLSFFSMFFGTSILTVSLFLFSYAMSELTNVGLGGFIGSGNLDVGIAGEGITVPTACSWGPSMGFFFYLIAICICISLMIFSVYKNYFLLKKKNVKLIFSCD